MASILLNAFGAGLAFVYFTFIRTGLMPGPQQLDVRTQTWYFVFVMIVIFSAATLVSMRYPGRLWRDLATVKDERDPKHIEALVGRFLNLPFASSALSLFAWLAAGVCSVFSHRYCSFVHRKLPSGIVPTRFFSV